MRWTRKLRLRLRSLFRSRSVEKELSEELQYHLKRLIDDQIAAGVSPDDARYAALREMGAMVRGDARDRDQFSKSRLAVREAAAEGADGRRRAPGRPTRSCSTGLRQRPRPRAARATRSKGLADSGRIVRGRLEQREVHLFRHLACPGHERQRVRLGGIPHDTDVASVGSIWRAIWNARSTGGKMPCPTRYGGWLSGFARSSPMPATYGSATMVKTCRTFRRGCCSPPLAWRVCST
jgi:hypothetical protein